MSNTYGFVHLLRLFVRMTEMLGYTKWKAQTLEMISRHCQDFLMFLSKNKDQYYNLDEDYETAPPDYQKRVWAAPTA
uniref:MRG domain-containing protein n=1 Tax=Acrobeloides nanus TaxID=290746 RepID=A0A914DE86_9BILA